MNILFVCGNFYPYKGGAETLADDVATRLSAQGHDVSVLTRRFPSLAAYEERNGYEIHRLDYPVPYHRIKFKWSLFPKSVRIFLQVAGIVRRKKVEAVSVALFDMSAFYVWLLSYFLKFRFSIYLHGGEIRNLRKKSKYFSKLLLCCMKRSDAVVAVSEALKREAVAFAGIDAGKVCVIRNGIDRVRMDACIPMKRSRPYLLFAGRLEPVKNVKTLVKAFESISSQIPHMDFLIAGTGSQEAALREKVSKAGLQARVEFLGALERDKLYSVMKGASFVVMASLAEGFPLVPLEAMGAGKIIVGSRVKGMTEVVEEGRTGVLFELADESALAQLMLKFALDEQARQKMEREIRGLDFERYDIQDTVRKHLGAMSVGRRQPLREGVKV